MKLADRVAIVTAAGKKNAMGRGIARCLAAEGARLVLNSSTPANLDEAVEEVRAAGGTAVGVAGDAGSREVCRQMVEAAMSEYGRVDILVCNAGINAFTNFEELTEDRARQVVDVNFFGTFNLCQEALEPLKVNGGSIIVITSVHAESAYAGSSVYNFTKAGLNQFAATLGIELAPHRIRVNALEPGWMRTPGSTVGVSDEKIAAAEKTRIPWGRMGTAEDIGKAVLFLASDDADYMTASTMRVDGGLIAAETH
ncbi:MAG: short-chain dehydrogenase [Gemmatimonadetes bacterium]|nr:short-chain dehydrogenase [Gemmatimonadota bacterium]